MVIQHISFTGSLRSLPINIISKINRHVKVNELNSQQDPVPITVVKIYIKSKYINPQMRSITLLMECNI